MERPRHLAPLPHLRQDVCDPWPIYAGTAPLPASDAGYSYKLNSPAGLNISCSRLGSGASGEVFDGDLNGDKVAVKIIRGPVSGQIAKQRVQEQWMREQRTALVLARRPHRNLLRYYAAYETKDDSGVKNAKDGVIIMERGQPIPTPLTEPREDPLGPVIYPSVEKRLSAAVRVAGIAVSLVNALAHLHSVGKSMHRDVKPDNVLRTGDGRICLCDFSASRTQMYAMQRATTTHGVGTMGFLAPEMYARGASYCAKVDTWSLGCTLLAYYNCGRPYRAGEFYELTTILQWDAKNEERLADARAGLDRIVSAMLDTALPDEDPVIVALRSVISMCLRTDPHQRPSITVLQNTSELRVLAEASGEQLDVPHSSEHLEHLEDGAQAADSVEVVSALIENLVDRFDVSQTGHLDKWELDLVRDRLHRSLEEKDVRSLELVGGWLDFQRRCPEADLAAADDQTGMTLLHAIAQSDRPDELLNLLEDYCEEVSPGHPDVPLTQFLDVRDRDGRTPLWLAASAGLSPGLCARLLELGSDANASDNSGVSIMHSSFGQGFNRRGEQRVDIITALRAFGAKLGDRPGNTSQDLLKAAQLTVADARSIVSKLQSRLLEARQQRIATRMCRSAPAAMPLLRDVSDAAMDVDDESRRSSPLNMTVSVEEVSGSCHFGEARGEVLRLDANPALTTSDGDNEGAEPRGSCRARPQSGGESSVPLSLEVSRGASEQKPSSAIVARGSAGYDAVASLPHVSPARSATPTPLDATPARRSASRSGRPSQRPPPMPGKRNIEASPVAPRYLSFANRTRRTPSPSPGNSAPSSPDLVEQRDSVSAQGEESLHPEDGASAGSEVESKLRRHLLRLGKGHPDTAFRVADFDCDNRVGVKDLRHLLQHLQLADGEEAAALLKHFGQGMSMKTFKSWLRGSVSSTGSPQQMQLARPVVRRRNQSHGPSKVLPSSTGNSGAMLAELPGQGEHESDASPAASPDLLSAGRHAKLDSSNASAAAQLPNLAKVDRSRSPAKIAPRSRSHSRHSGPSSRASSSGSRATVRSESLSSSWRGRGHDSLP